MFDFFYDTAFKILEYKLTYLELFATIFGLLGVILATQKNWLTWPIGIFNIILSFFLFYHFQLYADMFLQVFYLILSISGWIYWKKDATSKNQAFKFNLVKISWSIIFIFSASLLIGYIQLQLPKLLPSVFKSAPSYPFWDATIVSLSIYGTFLLARQIRENWIVWMLVNTLATILYGIKEMYFTSILYSIFFILAIIGWIKWKPNLKN